MSMAYCCSPIVPISKFSTLLLTPFRSPLRLIHEKSNQGAKRDNQEELDEVLAQDECDRAFGWHLHGPCDPR